MESEKNSAMGSGKATEVRSLVWYQRELQARNLELEVYKALYWGLQVELDKLDTLRKKDIQHFALKQNKALERFRLEFENKPGGETSRVENKSGERKLKVKPGDICDEWDCDCEGHDEVDS